MVGTRSIRVGGELTWDYGTAYEYPVTRTNKTHSSARGRTAQATTSINLVKNRSGEWQVRLATPRNAAAGDAGRLQGSSNSDCDSGAHNDTTLVGKAAS